MKPGIVNPNIISIAKLKWKVSTTKDELERIPETTKPLY